MWIQPSTFSVSLALAATSSALVLRGEPYPSHSLQLRQKGKSRISAEAYSAPDDGVGLEELTRPDQTVRVARPFRFIHFAHLIPDPIRQQHNRQR
jgi:hypothetical protein